MARALGSDVPFFLTGGAAWVSGRGERMRPLKTPRQWAVVLVYPGFPSATPEAFRLLDKARNFPAPGKEGAREERGAFERGGFSEKAPPSREILIRALGGHPRDWPYGNDFLPVFLASAARETAEAYRGMLRDLTALGADFSGLSGAGSSCFGVFQDEGVAKEAVKVLSRQWNYVQLAFSLARRAKAVLQ
jgi:4-diphosphocytidyl-2-C-methyl-D-erythritol kinase